MFRRREDELNDLETGQGSLLGSESVKVLNPQESAAGAAAAGAAPGNSFVPAAARTATDTPARSGSGSSFRSAAAQEHGGRGRMSENKSGAYSAASGTQTERPRSDSRRILTVGSDILLKGEIATCDRLVIEGKVDAVLNDVGTLELAESGSFKGVATVENAEISGLFEGELVAKGRLVIYASGRVRGKITYGEIEIERGGELTGEIKTTASATSGRSGGREKPAFSKEEKSTVAA